MQQTGKLSCIQYLQRTKHIVDKRNNTIWNEEKSMSINQCRNERTDERRRRNDRQKEWMDEGRVEEMNGRNCGKKTFGYEGMKVEVKELMKNEESQGMNKEDKR